MTLHLLPWLFRDDVFRIESPRLWLRWPMAGDAEAIQAIASRKCVAEMTASWPHPLPEGEAARRIARMRQTNASGESLALVITRKVNPARAIGTVGVHVRTDGMLGMGYFLEPGSHRRGLMTEAVQGLTFAVFAQGAHECIRAAARTLNPASSRVLEKAGFARGTTEMFAAVARGGAIEVDWYELTRAVWSERRRTSLPPQVAHESAAVA